MRQSTWPVGVFAVVLLFGAAVTGPGTGAHIAQAALWSSDFDDDDDVDLADFAAFAACFNGPNRPPAAACEGDADLDGDGDVDLADFAIFAACFNGPNRPPVCAPDIPPGMVRIPAGEFEMGDSFNEGHNDGRELPVHAVWVDAFYMDEFPVAQERWDAVRAWATSNGYDLDDVGAGKAIDHPIQTVNWHDCAKWCNARSQKEGRTACYYTDAELTTVYTTDELVPFVKWDADGYRLPTEAEWEKAARGGATGRRFPWPDSDDIQHARANYFSSTNYSYDTSPTRGFHPIFAVDAHPYTSPVGYSAPNGYGLYDMAGNVWEWCNDWFGSDYYGSSPSSNPRGPADGEYRVIRGGCWGDLAYFCRVAYRHSFWPGNRDFILGFRCVVKK
ncbi:MAG: SUMF1/EgtB/PvdO family nonheme iron enzyme [Phycisphaerae bacterium]|nr:SUMF1/EgtB/PvdO family nonheme iron enzyme [Phycisphaerae bacterium]